MRESFRQRQRQLVHPHHVAVVDLPLLLGPDTVAVDLREVPVHVPLDVLDVGAAQVGGDHVVNVLADLSATHVEHELVAALGVRPPDLVEAPVGVRLVQLGLDVDHFRLDPQAELEAQGVDVLHQPRETLWELGKVSEPVPEARGGVVALPEPSVVEDQHLAPARGGGARELHDPLVGHPEIHGLPRVDQDRGHLVDESLRHEVLAVHPVVLVAHVGHARARPHHHALGRLERVSGGKVPLELVGVDSHVDPQALRLCHIRLDAKVARVYQVECVHVPVILRRGAHGHGRERIVLVAGSPAGGLHGGLAIVKLPLHDVALIGPRPAQLDEVEHFAMEVHGARVELGQADLVAGQVAELHAAHDGVDVLVYGVHEVDHEARHRIFEGHNQGHAIIRPAASLRELPLRGGHLVLPLGDLVAEVHHGAQVRPVLVLHREGGRPEVPRPALGVLVQHRVAAHLGGLEVLEVGGGGRARHHVHPREALGQCCATHLQHPAGGARGGGALEVGCHGTREGGARAGADALLRSSQGRGEGGDHRAGLRGGHVAQARVRRRTGRGPPSGERRPVEVVVQREEGRDASHPLPHHVLHPARLERRR
mmetsp:Transcript_33749/g.107199  ORF Transcript_33749/g.107199 Transcript_33749/m.107199 type:complete len:596 (-) Transcript_33749:884-2671(-)